MQLEDFAFGGDLVSLLSSLTCPFLLAPAGNDAQLWSEDGKYCTAFKASPGAEGACPLLTLANTTFGAGSFMPNLPGLLCKVPSFIDHSFTCFIPVLDGTSD